MVFVRGIDAYLTYKITPDLAYELNPLVSIWKQGWSALIFVNIAVIILSILFLHYSFKFPANQYYPQEMNLSIKEFVSYFLYNEKNSFYKIYFLVPYNRKVILNFCGYLFPRVFIVWSLVIIFHNFSLLHVAVYSEYSQDLHLWILIYLSILPITFYFFWNFFKIEYQKYKYLINAT